MDSSGQVTEFSIRKFEKRDLDDLVAMIHTNLDPFEDAGSVLAATYRRLNQFWNVYTADGAAYWVLCRKKDNQIVGGAGIGPFAGLNPNEKIGEIRELVITSQFRGLGGGKQLLRHCLDDALRIGYRRIYLETTPHMKHAQNLFARFNFKPVTLQNDEPKDLSSAMPCYFLLDQLEEL